MYHSAPHPPCNFSPFMVIAFCFRIVQKKLFFKSHNGLSTSKIVLLVKHLPQIGSKRLGAALQGTRLSSDCQNTEAMYYVGEAIMHQFSTIKKNLLNIYPTLGTVLKNWRCELTRSCVQDFTVLGET